MAKDKQVILVCDDADDVSLDRRNEINGPGTGRVHGTYLTLRDLKLKVSVSISLSDAGVYVKLYSGNAYGGERTWSASEVEAVKKEDEEYEKLKKKRKPGLHLTYYGKYST